MDTPKNSKSDITELQYRISQLEHLVISTSLTNSTSNSSLPGSFSFNQNSLLERVSQLEGLLAASESENANLCNELQLILATKYRDEDEFIEKIGGCNREISDLKSTIQLLELKLSKGDSRFESIQKYVNTLPSQEELDEAKETINQLETSNNLLNSEANALKHENSVLHGKVVEKESNYQIALMRLKSLEPLEEAQQEFLSRGMNNVAFSDNECFPEMLTAQRAQIIRSGKIISSLRDKLFSLESKKVDADMKIKTQTNEIERLNQLILSSQINTTALMQKVKQQEQEKNDLRSESEKLHSDVERRDNFLRDRDEQIENLVKLVTDIDICVIDLTKLVALGENIAHGEEPSVDALLGIPDFDLQREQSANDHTLQNEVKSKSRFASATSAFNDAKVNYKFPQFCQSDTNAEDDIQIWILERSDKIRNVRKTIEKLRNKVTDVYTDMLEGSTDACVVQ